MKKNGLQSLCVTVTAIPDAAPGYHTSSEANPLWEAILDHLNPSVAHIIHWTGVAIARGTTIGTYLDCLVEFSEWDSDEYTEAFSDAPLAVRKIVAEHAHAYAAHPLNSWNGGEYVAAAPDAATASAN